MPTITKTIRTAQNVWTFDVSMPPSGVPRILRIYGDITNGHALAEAIDLCKQEIVGVRESGLELIETGPRTPIDQKKGWKDA